VFIIIDPLSKQVEHVVDEVMNDDELVKDANPIYLTEKLAETWRVMNLHQIFFWKKNLLHHERKV
jgi:hypothetical protein